MKKEGAARVNGLGFRFAFSEIVVGCSINLCSPLFFASRCVFFAGCHSMIRFFFLFLCRFRFGLVFPPRVSFVFALAFGFLTLDCWGTKFVSWAAPHWIEDDEMDGIN